MNIEQLIMQVGYIGMFFIIFAESGLFFGFFLPGDSLLFTAGFLASQGFSNIWVLVISLTVAAISGDSVGYWFGRKVGPKIFSKDDSIFFNKKHLLSANEFYNKHGGKTIVIARFIPAVRTFVPIIAGVANMDYKTFISYNVFGGIFWVCGLTLGGYFLGKTVPNVDKYLLPIIFLIMLVSALPGILHFCKDKEFRDSLLASIKNFWKKQK